MYRISSFLIAINLMTTCGAAEISSHRDEATGWDIYSLRQGATVVRVAPAAGSNAFSVKVGDVEYFRVPDDLQQLRGVGFGNPILYPTPNRVRGAKFEFEGETYSFPPNSSGNFIHGLVHSVPWNVASMAATQDQAEITCELPFEDGTERYERFPLPHVLRMTIRVQDQRVRWSYQVDNRSGKKSIPFGVAFHPYFLYQGQRDQAYLQVPATHLMESIQQLPTGKLLDLEGNKLDARTPISLAGFVVDDVYFGMKSAQPSRIDFRDVNRRITLRTSDEFTHLVVYTPERPFFCVENQTCSTDAHNLAAQGQNKIAHLQVCPAGNMLQGWAEYEFEQR